MIPLSRVFYFRPLYHILSIKIQSMMHFLYFNIPFWRNKADQDKIPNAIPRERCNSRQFRLYDSIEESAAKNTSGAFKIPCIFFSSCIIEQLTSRKRDNWRVSRSELYQRPQNVSENDRIDMHDRRAITRRPTIRPLYRPLVSLSIQYPVDAPSRSIKLTFDDTPDRSVILPSAAGSSQSPRNVTADSIPFDAIWPFARNDRRFLVIAIVPSRLPSMLLPHFRDAIFLFSCSLS